MRGLLAIFALVVAAPGLQVQATVKTPAEPIGIAFGAGSAWTASFDFDGVVRIDARTNAITARIKTGRGPIGVAYGAGSVWVANWSENTISRIDPKSGRRVAKIKVTARGPEGMAFGGGQLWVCRTSPAAFRASTRPRTARPR